MEINKLVNFKEGCGKKLKEQEGSGVIEAVVLFLFAMILLSVLFEYIRIQILANGVRDSFERAVLTVASENYNEVYAGFREVEYMGGIYEGGPEGGGYAGEIPEWLPLNDYGNVAEELQELLNLEIEESLYINVKDNYTLDNIQVEIRNNSFESAGRYEIKGMIKMHIPIYFSGIKVMDTTIPVGIKTAYTPKY